ncbi:MAG: Fe-S cluster assembly protein NifU [Candidatus Scalindua rubra]|uniref:Nitrogen fixation protein NifU n=1 Tax=Candidatus Scalindua brodae TaxID=237368 RepID=A0A0B0EJF2_9BACT|nr:MAG: iron sulfur [Fe-S] cofactor protein NifU [Candidatus Scalindua brodae]MBZ0108198.1 Fe-S cluster assembly protein NifU [Candidatus Scalindua rubra]
MWDYTDKVKEYFMHPKNVGVIDDADAVGDVGSITCGDALKLMLKVEDGTEKILDAKFQTFGCGSAIASSSALTEMIIGKTINEAEKITNQDIADFLGGLPKEKMHCSVMGREALEAAIANYRGIDLKQLKEDEGSLVCKCFGIYEGFIKKVVQENSLKTVEEVTNYTKAGGGCQSCHPAIEDIIEKVWKEKGKYLHVEEEAPMHKPAMTNLQRIALITDTIDKEIRPTLVQDGGDLDLIDIAGNEVFIALRGQCAACSSATYTTESIEAKLREMVSPDIVVHLQSDS